MYRFVILILSLYLMVVTSIQAQPQANSYTNRKVSVVRITITSLEVGEKVLKLGYEIRNEANYDTWILGGIGKFDLSAEIFIEN